MKVYPPRLLGQRRIRPLIRTRTVRLRKKYLVFPSDRLNGYTDVLDRLLRCPDPRPVYPPLRLPFLEHPRVPGL